MTPEETAAQARIGYIQRQQSALAKAVELMQQKLADTVINRLQRVFDQPAELDSLFRTFTAGPYRRVVGQFVSDILTVGRKNGEYFQEVLTNELPKDYAAIKASVNDSLLQRFGLDKQGNPVPDGFIDLFVKDTTVQRTAKQFAYNAQASGIGLDEFKKGLKQIIEGDSTRLGGYQKHFNQYAYDTYQQTDSLLQDQFAERLGLEAALYAGGEIAGTRPFCRERAGKVFTRDEIASWSSLTFAGKTPNYNPFIDRGGYNCRHHLNYITNKMAARRRSDLEIGPDGKLRKAGDPIPAPKATDAAQVTPDSKFTPSASIKDAEDYAVKSGFAQQVDFGKMKLADANLLNARLTKLHAKYNTLPLDELAVTDLRNNGTPFGNALATYGHGPSAPGGSIRFNQVKLEKGIPDSRKTYEGYRERVKQYAQLKIDWPELFKGSAGAKNRKIVLNMEAAAKFDRWTVAEQYGKEGTLVHEFGHKLHNEIIGLREADKRINKALVPQNDARLLNEQLRIIHQSGLNNGDIHAVSNYGSTVATELFAEAFTMLEFEPEKLPDSIKNIMLKILKYATK